jgi:hypothetical protein
MFRAGRTTIVESVVALDISHSILTENKSVDSEVENEADVSGSVSNWQSGFADTHTIALASAVASLRISLGTSLMVTLNSNIGVSLPRPHRLTSQ